MARKNAGSFTAEERAAMKERAEELKAEGRAKKSKKGKADGESEVLAKIAEMPEPDRTLGKRLHAIVRSAAPDLQSKLWYGMPAYANAEGKVVCFFQSAAKFKTRYSSFSFCDAAKLDDGAMWPVGFALKQLAATDEAKIATLVRRAIG